MMKITLFIYCLALVGIITAGGCSSEPAGIQQNSSTINTNTTAANTGASGNQMNMTANKNNFNAPAPTPVNKNTLSAALKEHLKSVKPNVLTEENWKGDTWLDLNLGIFYKKDNEHIRDEVCRVTIKLLEANNEKLTEFSQSRLRKNLSHETLCKNAVAKMLDASLDTEKIVKDF